MHRWGIAVAMVMVVGCPDGGAEVDPGPLPPPPSPDMGHVDPPSPDMGPLPPPGLPPAYPSTPATVETPTSVAGGTLLVTHDGSRVVAADPARDRIYVSPVSLEVDATVIELEPGDEPWRAVEDAHGRVHVTLRRGGAIVTLDVELATIVARRPVCPAPRGLAYDPEADSLLVACADGDLVTLPATEGDPTARHFIAPDLRDVIVTATHRYVTRFRSAELLTVDPSGAILERRSPVSATVFIPPGPVDVLPNVAWRARALADGSVVMLHQRSVSSSVDVSSSRSGGGYGASDSLGCKTSVVQTTLTHFPPSGTDDLRAGPILDDVGLGVDFAIDQSERWLIVTSAGAHRETLHRFGLGIMVAPSPTTCAVAASKSDRHGGGDAVAALPNGHVLVQRREPALLRHWDPHDAEARLPARWLDRTLSIASRGHDIFHQVTGAGIACASCHPEGGEDGHTWEFEGTPPRRTQTLLGGILGTEPFHWAGDVPDLQAIMQTTFSNRMRGGVLTDSELDDLGHWLDAQAAPPAPETDPVAAAEGHEVFITAGCADCHAGERGTNNETVTLDGRGALQVPMLVGVAHRSPWLNDGCAQSLEETFDGGCVPEHVPATALGDAETAALLAYLRSL